MKLRPYQVDCIQKIKNAINKGIRLIAIVLATGTGKTTIFSQFPGLVHKSGKKTLVLAHREELLTQAAAKIQEVSPELVIEIEQGSNYASDRADVIVASVATLGRTGSDRIRRFNPDDFGLIIVDEVHHIVATTYQNILTYFGANKNTGLKNKHPVVLGVTATPNRRDNVGLNTIFDELVFKYDIKQGIEEGYLSPIKAYTILTDTSLDGVGKSMGDFVLSELAQAVDNEERNNLILKSYKEICDGEKAVAFCVDVAHTKHLSDLFCAAGYKAQHISGETDKEERKKILKDFSDGELQVLFNCQLLTEGYDNPKIKAVLFARPTTSGSLFIQMGGRGTRLSPGKDHVKFLDFVDNMSKNSIISSSHLIGLDKPILAKGHDLMGLQDKFEELLSSNPNEDLLTVDIDNIDIRIREVDIFKMAQLPDIVKKHSSYAWIPTIHEGFKLSLGSNKSATGEHNQLCVEIKEDTLGKFDIYVYEEYPDEPNYKNGYKKVKRQVIHEIKATSQLDAIEKADVYIYENYKNKVGLVNQEAGWRSDSPTDKQIQLLKKFGYQNAEQLSKGEACILLSKHFAKNTGKRTGFTRKKK